MYKLFYVPCEMMNIVSLHPDAFLLPDFLTNEECQAYIDMSEAIGYEEAGVTTGKNQSTMIKSIRNNYRLIYTDEALAEQLFQRAKPALPAQMGLYNLLGFNEQFRFYRYDVGERFNKHRDGHFVRNVWEESFLTFLIYLNEDFEGGETAFDDFSVKPQTGTALCFLHELKHTGTLVHSGTKYVLRTDVMFRMLKKC